VKKKGTYYVINSGVLALTVVLFAAQFRKLSDIFAEDRWITVLLLLMTAVLVHVLKALRLYLALYGSDVRFPEFIKTYCRVTPVSMVFPFKLGEFFRMYCYGTLMRNALKGVIIILLDRFMDTMALVTTALLIWTLNGGQVTSLVSILLVFLAAVLIVYHVWPEIYKFWKTYLLKAKASENRLALLNFLEKLHLLYWEVENMVRGRGIILYIMSMVAWGVEIGGLAIRNTMNGHTGNSQLYSEYLVSAMGVKQSPELKQFVIISVGLMIIIYLMINAVEATEGKKEERP